MYKRQKFSSYWAKLPSWRTKIDWCVGSELHVQNPESLETVKWKNTRTICKEWGEKETGRIRRERLKILFLICISCVTHLSVTVEMVLLEVELENNYHSQRNSSLWCASQSYQIATASKPRWFSFFFRCYVLRFFISCKFNWAFYHYKVSIIPFERRVACNLIYLTNRF